MQYKRLVVVFVVLVLVCGAGEGVLHVWGQYYLRHAYDADFTGRTIDQESTKVLCLGESSTIGIWVDQQDSYPAQLERLLRTQYRTDAIQVIVPPHIGQNTSQMANRMHDYIARYHPALIVMMVGCNNHWSLAESHITKFLPPHSLSALRMKTFIFLNQFHMFKLARFMYLRLRTADPALVEGWPLVQYLAGAPQRMHHIPPSWVLETSTRDAASFVALWRYDVELLIAAAKEARIPVILMTYPVPINVPTDEFIAAAERENVALIRNDSDFWELGQQQVLSDYIFERDHWHPTAKGYTVVARNVCDAIVKDDLLGFGGEPAAVPGEVRP